MIVYVWTRVALCILHCSQSNQPNRRWYVIRMPGGVGLLLPTSIRLGYLARKSDGSPGTLTLWRGWKRLTDLTEGWALANQS